MKRLISALAFVCLLAPSVEAVNLRPLASASIGYIERGGNVGRTHVSYWVGAHVKELFPGVNTYAVYQRVTLDELSLTGDGGKVLIAVDHQYDADFKLLIGGGWLNDFALEGDGSRTTALTIDCGMWCKWSEVEEVGIVFGFGALVSAIDYGPRFDYTINVGPTVNF
jgi:hypothetical protein